MFQILIGILIFLVPLFFLPLTPEFFDTGKIFLLTGANLILLVVWLIKIIKEKTYRLRSGKLDFFVVLFGLSFILSFIFNWGSMNRYQGFAVTSYILSLIIFYFIVVNNSQEKNLDFYKKMLTLSGIVISVVSFILFFIPKTSFPLIFKIPLGYQLTIPDLFWSANGNTLVDFAFLAILAIILLPDFTKKLKEQFSKTFLFHFVSLLIIVAGVFLAGYKLVALKHPVLLPLSAGWVIMVEGFKPWTNFLTGIGPGQFATAFTKFKPVSFNQNPLWNLRFGTSTNEYFQLISTVGVLGLLAFVFLSLKGLRISLKKRYYLLPAVLIVFLLTPSSTLTYFLFFLAIAKISISTSSEKAYQISNNLFYFLPAGFFLIFGFLVYAQARTYVAEAYYQKALISIASNKGQDAYNYEVKAIQINPYNDTYHLSFSLLNMTIANNLVQKKNLSDQEKTAVSNLLTQALNESRSAASLAPNNSLNWENLAQIYRNLINVAQGADQWAVSALQQAISLDPTNPTLRLEQGGLYYSLANYDLAIDQFKLAIQVKPDYANAYYNLAYAYKEKKEYQSAAAAMEAVLTVVKKDSNDFKQASADLEALKKLIPTPEPTKAAAKPETLSLPSPVPSIKPEMTPMALPSPNLPKPTEATKAGE